MIISHRVTEQLDIAGHAGGQQPSSKRHARGADVRPENEFLLIKGNVWADSFCGRVNYKLI